MLLSIEFFKNCDKIIYAFLCNSYMLFDWNYKYKTTDKNSCVQNVRNLHKMPQKGFTNV